MANVPFPELQDTLTAAAHLVAPDKELSFRAMFGGAGVYVDGIIMGCTEIPFMLGADAEAAIMLNPAQLLAEAAVRRALE